MGMDRRQREELEWIDRSMWSSAVSEMSELGLEPRAARALAAAIREGWELRRAIAGPHATVTLCFAEHGSREHEVALVADGADAIPIDHAQLRSVIPSGRGWVLAFERTRWRIAHRCEVHVRSFQPLAA